MAYQADIYNVMLASPSDVNEERQVAREIILDWNNINSRTRKIVLLPISWEYNSIPSTGDRPQEIINEQVLKNADILVGIFWTRIGTPTGKAISGTVEEIEKHINSGKPAMLYFSKKPVVPDSIDHEQYEAVKKLKKEFQSKNLTADFETLDDFKTKFQRHLSMRLNEDQYLKNETSGTGDFMNSHRDLASQLTNEAKELLIAASVSPSGKIMKLGFKGGFSIQVNGRVLNNDSTPRTSAKWEAVIQELLDNDLISEHGYQGQIFSLTKEGFELADKLKSEV
jgi:hypothetical protein